MTVPDLEAAYRALRQADSVYRRQQNQTQHPEIVKDARAIILTCPGVSPSELARQLRITTASTSVLIRKMVASGLIAVSSDPVDSRRKHLAVLPHEGTDITPFDDPVPTWINGAASGLTPEQQGVVTAFLIQMTGYIDRSTE